MKSLKGTKTERNILTAFAGESQARNRYTYFAKKAKEEGLEQIAGFFLETADNEMEHARRLFGFLQGGIAEIKANFPAGVVGSTKANLKEAADGENYEHSKMYPEFAQVADKEGFDDVACAFRAIAIAEKHHEKRYIGMLDNLNGNRVFKKDKPVKWKCRNCGFVMESTEAPDECPACKYGKPYFEVLSENW